MFKFLWRIWRKKFVIAVLIVLVILLPNAITRQSQLQNTMAVTTLGIDIMEGKLTVACEIVKSEPESKSVKYAVLTAEGKNIADALHSIETDYGKSLSLSHCTAVIFANEINIDILNKLTQDTQIRTNASVVRTDADINELLTLSGKDADKNGGQIGQIIKYNKDTATIDSVRRGKNNKITYLTVKEDKITQRVQD
jgi:hypothetical protein